MKTFLTRQSLSRITQLIGCLVTIACGASFAAGSDDPTIVGTWDCLSSGGRYNGIAFITFSNDNTLHGYEMWVPHAPPSSAANPRGGVSSGRGSISNSSGKPVLFGFGPINGIWNYDPKGNLVGIFSEAAQRAQFITNYSDDCSQSTNISFVVTNSDGSFAYVDSTNLLAGCFSNAVLETNFQWSVFNTNDNTLNSFSTNVAFNNSNFTLTPGEPIDVVNSVTFKGKAVGSRLTIVGTSDIGRLTYRGVSSDVLTDLSGSWFGLEKQNGQESNEFFDLTRSTISSPSFYPDAAEFPNIYFTTNGVGAGYTVDLGIVMLSVQKKIGFTFIKNSTSTTSIRTTIGPVPKSGSTFSTKGTLEGSTPIRFDATLMSAP